MEYIAFQMRYTRKKLNFIEKFGRIRELVDTVFFLGSRVEIFTVYCTAHWK